MIGKLAPKQYQGVMMGSWMLVTGLASLFAGDFSGMIPEPTGTTAVATNAGYAKLFAELGAGSLAVGIALVVLIPFLRKLITDKAETAPIEAGYRRSRRLKLRELRGAHAARVLVGKPGRCFTPVTAATRRNDLFLRTDSRIATMVALSLTISQSSRAT